MGKNHSHISDHSPDFNYNQWEENTQFTQALGSQIGVFKTFKNKRTQQLVDCYQAFFPSQKDYQDYVDNFNWRLNQEDIVNTKYLQPQIKTQLCSTTYLAKVYIQHPRARLSDFKDIPSPDNLYCLSVMLDGFGKLFQKIGRFPIAQDQIAISENGKIKVWLNSDYSKNYPSQFQIQFKHQTQQEMQQLMVQQIVKMVALNTDQSSQPQVKFIDYFQRQRYSSKMGFSQVKQIIQEYAEINNLRFQDYFKSVVQIYNNQQVQQQQQQIQEQVQQLLQDKVVQVPKNNRNYPKNTQINTQNNRYYAINQQNNHNRPTQQVISSPYVTNHSSQNNLFKQPQLVSIHNSMGPSYRNILIQPNNINTFSNSAKSQFHSPFNQLHQPQKIHFRPSTQGYSHSPNFTPLNVKPNQYHQNRLNNIIIGQQQQNLHIGYKPIHIQNQFMNGVSYVQPFFQSQKSIIKNSPSKITQPFIYQRYPTPHRIQNWSTINHNPKLKNQQIYKQNHIIKKQTKQFGVQEQQQLKRQRKFYYTIQDQVQLDPQIAADMLQMI